MEVELVVVDDVVLVVVVVGSEVVVVVVGEVEVVVATGIMTGRDTARPEAFLTDVVRGVTAAGEDI